MNFKEYYEYYLTLHKHPKCRLMHFIGQLTTIAFVVFIFFKSFWVLIPLVPFIVYPFAWFGHYYFEKNKPAAFSDPWKAKASDWVMFKDIILRRLTIW